MFLVQYFSHSDISTEEFSSFSEAKNFFDNLIINALSSPNWTCGNMQSSCIQLLLEDGSCMHAIRLGDLR